MVFESIKILYKIFKFPINVQIKFLKDQRVNEFISL
jgi:hypothetical protein